MMNRLIVSRKICLFAFLLATVLPTIVLAQPIDGWSFDEQGGTIAHNSVPGRADGTLTEGAVFVPGIIGNAVYLPPFASVDFALPAGDFGVSDFTISFWLKTNGDGIGNMSAAYAGLLGNRGAEENADTPFMDFRIGRDGFLSMEMTGFGGSGYVAAITDPIAGRVNDGNWHYVTAVRQGPQIQLSVDGVLRATGTAADGTVANVQSLYGFTAGANANTFNFDIPFDGTIDDLRLYNEVLSDGDGDGFGDDVDNCPLLANPSQADFDHDGLGDACDNDLDNDGVKNNHDICDSTPPGTVVGRLTGCSIAELCPCAGPMSSTKPWRNHGQYVSCVTVTATAFWLERVITHQQKVQTIHAAVHSSCGN